MLLDAERGLVAVDRNTVTSTLGDVHVTVGRTATVRGRVVYVHPVHNFAVVQFDPKEVPADVTLRAARLKPRPLPTGASVWLVGLKSGLNEEFDSSRRVDVVARKTRVANSGWMKLPLPNPPRYQVLNVETVGLEVSPSLDGGVVADASGAVCALWVSCAYQASNNHQAQVFRGLPVSLLQEAADHLGEGREPPPHTPGVTPLAPWPPASSACRKIISGTARRWRQVAAAAQRRLTRPPTRRAARPARRRRRRRRRHRQRAARPRRRARGGGRAERAARDARPGGVPASRVLRGGDVLLGVGGEAVRSLYAAEVAVNKAPPSLKLDVMRDGKPLTVDVETLSSDGLGTQRVVGFAGLLVQHVPDAVMAQRQVAPNGVYCAYRYYGSPSSRYDLPPTSRIVEVDAAPTPDLSAFLEQVTKKRDGESFASSTSTSRGGRG